MRDLRKRGRARCNAHTVAKLRQMLQSDEIQLDLLIAVVACPQIERRACHLVNERDGHAEPRTIHRLDIPPTGLARIEPQMLEGRRLKVREFVLVLFAAPCTDHAAERPQSETGPALQRTSGAIAAGGFVENGNLRRAAAERASILGRPPPSLPATSVPPGHLRPSQRPPSLPATSVPPGHLRPSQRPPSLPARTEASAHHCA